MLLQGIFPAATTPFYPDGAVYYKKIEHNVDRYSRTPIAGLVILGSTGEAVMLSDEERREVLRTSVEAAAPEKVLIAGTGAESVVETLRLTEYAARLKYDVVLADCVDDLFALSNRVRQRLLAVDVFLGGGRGYATKGVPMVGRRDHHRVDVFASQ